jgi:hypothetical protein
MERRILVAKYMIDTTMLWRRAEVDAYISCNRYTAEEEAAIWSYWRQVTRPSQISDLAPVEAEAWKAVPYTQWSAAGSRTGGTGPVPSKRIPAQADAASSRVLHAVLEKVSQAPSPGCTMQAPSRPAATGRAGDRFAMPQRAPSLTGLLPPPAWPSSPQQLPPPPPLPPQQQQCHHDSPAEHGDDHAVPAEQPPPFAAGAPSPAPVPPPPSPSTEEEEAAAEEEEAPRDWSQLPWVVPVADGGDRHEPHQVGEPGPQEHASETWMDAERYALREAPADEPAADQLASRLSS